MIIPVLSKRLDAGEIMVVQSPNGQLTWHLTPGRKWRGFGKVTKYRLQERFWFPAKHHPNDDADAPIRIRFNDGIYASISGSLTWQLPLDKKALTTLHAGYGNRHAIQKELIYPAIENALAKAGSVMSARESYGQKRDLFLLLLEDQLENSDGVELSSSVLVVEGKRWPWSKGRELSLLRRFGIKISDLSVSKIVYDPEVEEQIKLQHKSLMRIELAIAHAKEAEQEAITVAKQGEANAAIARWEQEVVRAKATIEATQRVEVAQLDAQTAQHSKLIEDLRTEWEATRAKLTMEATGTREKLAAYVEVNKAYAEAIGNHKGNLVPSVIMGTGNPTANGVTGAQELLTLLALKTARDLDIEVNLPVKGDRE